MARREREGDPRHLSLLFLFYLDLKTSTWLLGGTVLEAWTISGPVILHRQGSGGVGLAVRGSSRRGGAPPLRRFCDIVSIYGDNITELLLRIRFRLLHPFRDEGR